MRAHQGGLPFNSVINADVLSRTSTFKVVEPPRKRVRAVSIGVANRLRDEAKRDRAAGRETKAQQVHRCLAAFINYYAYPPTPAELCRFMAERHEISVERVNLVSPRLSEGINGIVRRDVTGAQVRVGGGLYELLPLRVCRVTGDMAHPVRIREVGGSR